MLRFESFELVASERCLFPTLHSQLLLERISERAIRLSHWYKEKSLKGKKDIPQLGKRVRRSWVPSLDYVKAQIRKLSGFSCSNSSRQKRMYGHRLSLDVAACIGDFLLLNELSKWKRCCKAHYQRLDLSQVKGAHVSGRNQDTVLVNLIKNRCLSVHYVKINGDPTPAVCRAIFVAFPNLQYVHVKGSDRAKFWMAYWASMNTSRADILFEEDQQSSQFALWSHESMFALGCWIILAAEFTLLSMLPYRI